ncbi:hypothetical protein M0813_16351 [Anaeramoeba flamelloides]|uniref:Glycosyltransferase family 69 protein n=1 Tax=Anaeramoeba flamelloides TaxID=1746091 RepID=A0ABQ8YZW5_9EUKA|nr:hypothetical protein M0813_16351 [Anaeramoeba flamelloides]
MKSKTRQPQTNRNEYKKQTFLRHLFERRMRNQRTILILLLFVILFVSFLGFVKNIRSKEPKERKFFNLKKKKLNTYNPYYDLYFEEFEDYEEYEDLNPYYQEYPGEKLFVAFICQDIAKIWDTLEPAFLGLIDFVGTDNIYMSIYSNGNTDITPLLLQIFEKKLDALGVANTITPQADSNRTAYNHERILYLANLRNKVLEPLTPEYPKVMFINDIMIQFRDLKNLLLTPIDYDMVCGLDFQDNPDFFNSSHQNDKIKNMPKKKKKNLTFLNQPGKEHYILSLYDIWAARDAKGDTFSNDYPWFNDHKNAKPLIDRGLPVQVYACWNGVVVFKSEPWFKEKIKFRRSNEDECYSSECQLFPQDLWRHGYKKIFINPLVQSSYDQINYNHLLKTKYYQNTVLKNDHITQYQKLINSKKQYKIIEKIPEYVICCDSDEREVNRVDWLNCHWELNLNT